MRGVPFRLDGTAGPEYQGSFHLQFSSAAAPDSFAAAGKAVCWACGEFWWCKSQLGAPAYEGEPVVGMPQSGPVGVVISPRLAKANSIGSDHQQLACVLLNCKT